MAGQRFALPANFLRRQPELKSHKDQTLVVGLRPEYFLATSPERCGDGWLRLTVAPEVVETLGAVNYVHFTLPDPFDPENPELPFIARWIPRFPPLPSSRWNWSSTPAACIFSILTQKNPYG
jgi:hypothetical protein